MKSFTKFAAVVLSVFFAFATSAHAGRLIVHKFDGTIDEDFGVVGFGTLESVFSSGSTFTLTHVFRDNAVPDQSHFNPGRQSSNTWSGAEITLSIDGHSYSMGPHRVTASVNATTSCSFCEVGLSIVEFGHFVPSPTSSHPSIDLVSIQLTLLERDLAFEPIDFANPRVPRSFDLSMWSHGMFFRFIDLDATGNIVGQASIDSFNTSTALESVEIYDAPTPGAALLLGVGLLGLTLRQRRLV